MASRRYAADYTVPAMADVPPDTISADFPFESRYAAVDGVRLHYIDEGSGPPVLFLHGSPTWSYIWRNVIPHLSSRFRCVALDLAGMGMSEKPDVEYRLFDHARYVEGFIASLGLRGLTLVMHDWGSKLGFHYARRHESNVRASALLGSMFMPIASWNDIPDDFRETLRAWRGDAGWDLIVQRNVFFENVLPSGVVRTLTDEELRRYRAPYADEAARRVLWQWPREIPIEGEPADTAAAMTSRQRLARRHAASPCCCSTPRRAGSGRPRWSNGCGRTSRTSRRCISAKGFTSSKRTIPTASDASSPAGSPPSTSRRTPSQTPWNPGRGIGGGAVLILSPSGGN